jgi:hypothetical protein
MMMDATPRWLKYDRRTFDRLVDDGRWRHLNGGGLGALFVAVLLEPWIVLAAKAEQGEQEQRFHPRGRRHSRRFRSEKDRLGAQIPRGATSFDVRFGRQPRDRRVARLHAPPMRALTR